MLYVTKLIVYYIVALLTKIVYFINVDTCSYVFNLYTCVVIFECIANLTLFNADIMVDIEE